MDSESESKDVAAVEKQVHNTENGISKTEDGGKPARENIGGVAIAPIKKEFLYEFSDKKDPYQEEQDAENAGNNQDSAENSVIKSDTKKGRNKKRPRDAKADFDDTLCRTVAKEGLEACPYGEKCRFNHDVLKYLSRKPKDIGSSCYLYETFGECPAGLTCRFGSAHLSVSLKKIFEEAKMDENQKVVLTMDVPKSLKKAGAAGVPEPLNSVSDAVKLALRKDEYPFHCERRDKFAKQRKKNKKNKKREEKEKSEATAAAATGEPTKGEHEKGTVPAAAEAAPAAPSEEGKAAAQPAAAQPAVPAAAEAAPAAPSEEGKAAAQPAAAAAAAATGGGGGGGKPLGAGVALRGPRKLVDFSGKVYVAPLTTVGNLPFRRCLVGLGADVTCSEMAMAANLLTGQRSEWALVKRHPCERAFGVQLAGAHADQLTRAAQLLEEHVAMDFVDLNLGCPIDLVCQRGAGSALMLRTNKVKAIVGGMLDELTCPVTVKMRTGWGDNEPVADKVVRALREVAAARGPPGAVAAVMVHGRSRTQRYTRLAKWDYINSVASGQKAEDIMHKPPAKSNGDEIADDKTTPAIISEENSRLPVLPVIGNGDILSWRQWEDLKVAHPDILDCAMLGRGALIKPWLPTEIKEQRDWDISAGERLDIFQDFVKFGLEHWGSDTQGVNTTRRFLLEWVSFTHRYVPVGVMEHLPLRINDRPKPYFGRNDLETLMASPRAADWVRLSEMLLGPVPEGFRFAPKHKSNSYIKG